MYLVFLSNMPITIHLLLMCLEIIMHDPDISKVLEMKISILEVSLSVFWEFFLNWYLPSNPNVTFYFSVKYVRNQLQYSKTSWRIPFHIISNRFQQTHAHVFCVELEGFEGNFANAVLVSTLKINCDIMFFGLLICTRLTIIIGMLRSNWKDPS